MSPSIGDGDTATRQIHRRGASASNVVRLVNPNTCASERAYLDLPATDQVQAAGFDPWYHLNERPFYVVFGKSDAPLPHTVFTIVLPVLDSKVNT